MGKTVASRGVWQGAGIVCFVLGCVGYVLPVMPGTVFLILSLYCFKRGNERFERWLLNHRWFGRTLRDWDETRSMSARVKVIAIALLWVSILASITVVEKQWVKGMLLAIAVSVTAYLLWVRTKPSEKPQDAR